MNLIDRAKNILTNPKAEWEVIDNEPANVQNIIIGYVLPLVAIGAIATFIGWSFVGKSYYGFKFTSMNWGIRYGIIALVSGIAGVLITAAVIDALAPTFKSEKNFGKSVQLAAYSYTPGWIGAIFGIIPSLALIGSLIGLYGLYLLYIGLPKMKKTPPEQTTGYFVVSLITMLLVYFVIGLILAAILIPTMGVTTIRDFNY